MTVDELADAVAIEAGAGHTCALLGDGDIKCWGKGSLGQLGYGGVEDHAIPLIVDMP